MAIQALARMAASFSPRALPGLDGNTRIRRSHQGQDVVNAIAKGIKSEVEGSTHRRFPAQKDNLKKWNPLSLAAGEPE